MRLAKMAFALLAIHLGFGFTQFVVSYYQGDVTDYGAGGWIAHTPIGEYIDLESTQQENASLNLTDIRSSWDHMNKLGDIINGLASFNYGFLSAIPNDTLAYTVVMIFRVVSVCFWIALGLALLYFLFDSGILNSKLGMSIVGLGLGLGALSSVGALFGGG